MNVHTKGFCPQTQNASYYNALFFSEKCPPSERVKGVCRTAGTNWIVDNFSLHRILREVNSRCCTHCVKKDLYSTGEETILNLIDTTLAVDSNVQTFFSQEWE